MFGKEEDEMAGTWNNRDGEVAMRKEMERLPDVSTPAPHYCYSIQAWVVGDVVDWCGHAEIKGLSGCDAKCYACEHAGEIHDRCDGCKP